MASGKRRGEVEVRVALGAGLRGLWVGHCAEAVVCVWACVLRRAYRIEACTMARKKKNEIGNMKRVQRKKTT